MSRFIRSNFCMLDIFCYHAQILLKVNVLMQTLKIVENIQKYCVARGITPTEACRESGVGRSLMLTLKRGSFPSVEKIHNLAQYLGISTSELLGEEDPRAEGPAQPYLVMRYNALSPENQEKVMAFIEFLVVQEDKKNVSESDT